MLTDVIFCVDDFGIEEGIHCKLIVTLGLGIWSGSVGSIWRVYDHGGFECCVVSHGWISLVLCNDILRELAYTFIVVWWWVAWNDWWLNRVRFHYLVWIWIQIMCLIIVDWIRVGLEWVLMVMVEHYYCMGRSVRIVSGSVCIFTTTFTEDGIWWCMYVILRIHELCVLVFGAHAEWVCGFIHLSVNEMQSCFVVHTQVFLVCDWTPTSLFVLGCCIVIGQGKVKIHLFQGIDNKFLSASSGEVERHTTSMWC